MKDNWHKLNCSLLFPFLSLFSSISITTQIKCPAFYTCNVHVMCFKIYNMDINLNKSVWFPGLKTLHIFHKIIWSSALLVFLNVNYTQCAWLEHGLFTISIISMRLSSTTQYLILLVLHPLSRVVIQGSLFLHNGFSAGFDDCTHSFPHVLSRIKH